MSLYATGADKRQSVRLPGSTLLSGYGSGILTVTRSSQVVQVPLANPQGDRTRPMPSFPSISVDGERVFCPVFRDVSDSEIGSYSISTNTWEKYGTAEHVWAIVASPDMRSLAYISNDRSGDPPRLHVLVMSTGETSVVPIKVAVPSSVSWSPNSERLTFQTDLSNELTQTELAIGVVDLRSGKTWMIGKGRSPSWSPSGEWIAYLDPTDGRVLLVHPDGSGQKTLAESPKSLFGARGQFYLLPVWSPDSRELLLNEVWDIERLDTDVLIYELSTGKLRRKFRDKTPVLGWAVDAAAPGAR